MNINPIVLSIPVFFILIGIELLVQRFTHQKLYNFFISLPGFTSFKDNMNTCKWLSLVILFFCFACDKPLPSLEGMDLQRWKEDKNACNNMRMDMRVAIDKEKNKLLSLDQMQIVELLGKPDQNELYKRNQKFFYYFLKPAPLCNVGRTDSVSEKLVIRFNAMGLAKEVSIE